MFDCLPSTSFTFSLLQFRHLGFSRCNWVSNRLNLPNSSKPGTSFDNCRFQSVILRGNFISSSAFESEKDEFRRELGFREKGDTHLDLESSYIDSVTKHNTVASSKGKKRDSHSGTAASSSTLDFLERNGFTEGEHNDRKLEEKGKGDFAPYEQGMEEESDWRKGMTGLMKRRQVMKRSSLVAKQVISIQSALSLGFVSQLWVDTTAWMVLYVEVRPNLLSGESEWLLLEDVSQVGDVVLVQDETLMENGFKMVGLETLVGYKVVTPARRHIGKVRGYTFNINSGAVESLELDSFGISIIPSTLVSTYALLVEDVLEVVCDAVVVHEAAGSRIQRLTKGFLGAHDSIEELGEELRVERSIRSDRNWRSRTSSVNQKFHRVKETDEYDWELPMDYL